MLAAAQPAEFRVSSGFELCSRPEAQSEAAPKHHAENEPASVLTPGGGTALHPSQGQDGEEANGELDKASSGVEKRFQGELEIAMDAEEKPFHTVAEEPTSFYF